MSRGKERGPAHYARLAATSLPLQEPFGGPNFFKLDPNAAYDIHIVNDGGATENLTFRFQFQNTLDDDAFMVGGQRVSIPLVQNGSADVATPNSPALNTHEKFTVSLITGATGS